MSRKTHSVAYHPHARHSPGRVLLSLQYGLHCLFTLPLIVPDMFYMLWLTHSI